MIPPSSMCRAARSISTTFQSLKGAGFKANYFDVETGDEYWISGCKRDGSDRVEGVIRLMQSDVKDPVNIGNPHEMTIEQIAREIIRLTGSKSQLVYRPLPVDDTDVQSDANGSAKVARLLVADSRAAWRVLMEVGRAAADGVPAALVRLLDELDAGLAARFPRAIPSAA